VDSDFQQLLARENVRIFSPTRKKYMFCKEPYKLLAKKMKCERADNLITPLLTEADREKRRMLVDLLSLPEFVEKKVLDNLNNIVYNRDFNVEKFPFKSLRKRFLTLYNADNTVSYEKCLKAFKDDKITKKKKNNII
jgi:uncharacterized protein (UPF0216 family)